MTPSSPASTRRTRVLIPGERPVPDDFYAERAGTEAREPLNKTAFRQAERKYKTPDAPLAEALDFGTGTDCDARSSHDEIVRIGTWTRTDGSERPVYGVSGVDGFIYVPQALTEDEQLHFATQSFVVYPRKPNASNLDAHYELPDEGMFPHVMAGESMTIRHRTDGRTELITADAIESRLIRKMRWVTLGYQYNWTTKEYNFDRVDEGAHFPTDLFSWTRQAVEKLGFGSDYRPEAGIVNYYQPDDTLTGHVDRSERNMTAPLVSISIGRSAIFLLGGRSRDDEPVRAIIVRSGDLSILSGPSRHFFHGVPRILPEHPAFLHPAAQQHDSQLNGVLTLMQNCRININVRQVT